MVAESEAMESLFDAPGLQETKYKNRSVVKMISLLFFMDVF
jgi:hypothetical protein